MGWGPGGAGCPASAGRIRSGRRENGVELLDVVLEMTDQEAVDNPPDGHLTETRVKPAAGRVSRRQGPDPRRQAIRLGGRRRYWL